MKPSEVELRRFLWGQLKPQRKWVIGSFLLAALIAAIETKLLSLIPRFVDDALIEKNMSVVILIGVALVVLMLIDGVVRFFHRFFLRVAVERAIKNVRNQIFERFLYFSKPKLQKYSSGKATSHIISDVFALSNANHVLSDVIREPLVFLFLSGYLFYLNWELSLVCVVCLPLIGLVAKRLGQSARRNQRRLQNSLSEISAHVVESMGGLETAHSLNQTHSLFVEFKKWADESYKYLVRLAKVEELVGPATKLTAAIIGSLMVFLGGYLVVRGDLSTGTLFGFITTAAMLQQPLRALNSVHVRLQQVYAASERIYAILNENIDAVSEAQKTLLNLTLFPSSRRLSAPQIVFDGVSYRYPARQDSSQREWAVHNIQLTFPAGQKVALVGQSGAGKSTLIQLLLRFADPNEGRILLNGRDIQDLPLADYRSYFAYVSQNPFLFNRNIRENLLMARPDASDEELWQALKNASIENLIYRLPQKLDTQVGENAKAFSGGERQRLALARAFLKEAPVLIFDEATSNLDSENEHAIQMATERLMQNRSAIIIAHRLSTIRHVDHIVVLSSGEIIEQGRLDELIRIPNGQFAKMWDLQ